MLRLFLTALLLFLAIACAPRNENNPARARNLSQKKLLQIPTLERFAIGDSFTYSNPTTTWQITDIRNNRLIWESNLFERMETFANPFLPALLWESNRYGEGRRSIGRKQGKLFPLRQGRTTRFSAKTTVQGKRRNFTWNCTVGDKQKTTVPAGTFQTFEVLCQRKNADALIYRYAPAIARIVEFRTPGLGLAQATRRQLIGYNSLAGAAFQKIQASLDTTTPTLSPLPPSVEEKVIPLYRPALPPVSPLPFAPPSNFFAPQKDSTPSPTPSDEQPATEPLMRLLEEALKEQQNRLPLLPQFDKTTPETVPPSPQPQPIPQQDESSETTPEETTPSPENRTSAVLLGSYPSLTQARQAWQKISADSNLTSALAGRKFEIIRNNDPTRGILYRLYVYPYINTQAAQEVCNAVRRQFSRNACRVTTWNR